MKQNTLLILAAAAVLSLTGCQTSQADAEKDAMIRQIDQLEQKVYDLEQQLTQTDSGASGAEAPGADGIVPDASPDDAAEHAPAPGPDDGTAVPAEGASALSTTYTMEALTDMVDAYEEKADAAVPSGSASDDMEQFLTLKHEEKQIDAELDLHEDELERLYRNGSLSRDEYKALERELERLEDRLDDAEDKLEYTFGIDD